MNDVGGLVAQRGSIPFETGMKAIGLEKEGKAASKWVKGSVEDMSLSLKSSLERHFELWETLLRDPDEFVELIEEEPWRIASLHPLTAPHAIKYDFKFTWKEEKLREFIEYDEVDIKLPKGWLSDL